jgi:histidine phosphotransferase ChpT
MVDILELSELLMAKLCHDLAGPIGAINNGVELLKDPSPAFYKESVELVEISAKDAVARLMYYRHAYGINRNGAGISVLALKELVGNFYKNKNLTFTWPESHGDADSLNLIKNELAKLLLNMILLVAGSLIHGGNIVIKIKNQKTNFGVKVRGEGKTVKLHEYLHRPLIADFKESEIDTKNVQSCLTHILAKRLGVETKVEISDSSIEIIAN